MAEDSNTQPVDRTIDVSGHVFRGSPARTRMGFPQNWFAISSKLVTRATTDEAKLARRRMHGKWYRIQGEGPAVYRILQFDPRLTSSGDQTPSTSSGESASKYSEITIDRQGWLALIDYEAAASKDRQVTLRITPVTNPFEWFRALWSMPSPAERGAFRVSVVLGGLSLVLGLISLVIALLP